MTEADPNLRCYGCAHSAANVEFPSRPSGERPCFFCIRNPEREEWARDHEGECSGKGCLHPTHGVWYDGTRSTRTPSDNYIAVDRLNEERIRDEPGVAA